MRVLVVGLGSIGRRHLANVGRVLPDANVTVWRHARSPGADEVPTGADRMVHTLEEALSPRPDLAILASPAPFHVSTATALAAAGIHMLVEKPLSDTMDGVDDLIAECARQRVILMVGYHLRFSGSLAASTRRSTMGSSGESSASVPRLGSTCPTGAPAPTIARALVLGAIWVAESSWNSATNSTTCAGWGVGSGPFGPRPGTSAVSRSTSKTWPRSCFASPAARSEASIWIWSRGARPALAGSSAPRARSSGMVSTTTPGCTWPAVVHGKTFTGHRMQGWTACTSPSWHDSFSASSSEQMCLWTVRRVARRSCWRWRPSGQLSRGRRSGWTTRLWRDDTTSVRSD